MVIRALAPVRLELKEAHVTASGVVEGYASRFGELDLGRDVVEKGAFTRSLKSRGAPGIAMLWGHDQQRPIGRWESVREDGKGLLVRGVLTLGTRDGDDAARHLEAKSMSGLSIGYITLDHDRRKDGARLLKAVDLREISLVAMPMLPTATATLRRDGGKASTDDIEHADELVLAGKALTESIRISAAITRARAALAA